jgi:hypothetical protein
MINHNHRQPKSRQTLTPAESPARKMLCQHLEHAETAAAAAEAEAVSADA